MALRNVINLPDDMLAKKSRDITSFDDKLWVLLDDMYETLQYHSGVGMAAVQVGILRRVIVIDLGEDSDEGLIELINPEIVQAKGKQRELEGCLSFPDMWGYVRRPSYVKVQYVNRHGKPQTLDATELLAIAVCHEIDHLDGVMFSDIADEMVENPPEEEKRANRGKRRRH